MQLPRALAPWSIYLNLFAYPVNTQLGAMVERIDRILGSYDAFTSDEHGEVEGYDGIDRRGDYERLVLSEWLLADELPDEFLRRAANGEHTFLQLARAQPSEKRKTTVLLDAGPSQLGTPRLAHLALLIVLARRADSFGAQFEWGVLQEPNYLMDGLTESGIIRLLRSRVLQTVTSEQADAWSSILDPISSEIWIIGPEDLKLAGIEKFSRATLIESFAPGERNLKLCVSAYGRSAKEISLPLPDDNTSARILRHPFAEKIEAARVEATSSISNVFFSGSGRHFVVRVSAHTVALYRTPTIPVRELKPKHYSSAGRKPIIAAGTGGTYSSAILLTKAGKNLLEVEFIGGVRANLRGKVELPFEIDDADYDHHIEPCVFTRSNSNEDDMFALLQGRLIRFSPNSKRGSICQAKVIDNDVTFLTLSDSIVVYSTKKAIVRCIDPRKESPITHNPILDFNQVRIGFGGENAHPVYGVLAIQRMTGEWLIEVTKKRDFTVGPPTIDRIDCGVMVGSQVHGVVGVQKDAGLIAVDLAAPRAPYIVGSDFNMKLPPCRADIHSLAVSHRGTIVYISKTGELVVYSPERAVLEDGCLFRSTYYEE